MIAWHVSLIQVDGVIYSSKSTTWSFHNRIGGVPEFSIDERASSSTAWSFIIKQDLQFQQHWNVHTMHYFLIDGSHLQRRRVLPSTIKYFRLYCCMSPPIYRRAPFAQKPRSFINSSRSFSHFPFSSSSSPSVLVLFIFSSSIILWNGILPGAGRSCLPKI